MGSAGGTYLTLHFQVSSFARNMQSPVVSGGLPAPTNARDLKVAPTDASGLVAAPFRLRDPGTMPATKRLRLPIPPPLQFPMPAPLPHGRRSLQAARFYLAFP